MLANNSEHGGQSLSLMTPVPSRVRVISGGSCSGRRQQNTRVVGKGGEWGKFVAALKRKPRMQIIFFTFPNPRTIKELGISTQEVTHPLTSSDVHELFSLEDVTRFSRNQFLSKFFPPTRGAQQQWPPQQQLKGSSQPGWKASSSASLAWATWARCMLGG